MLKMDGFDDCVAGIMTRFGMDPIICYDHAKVIRKLMKMGMDVVEATEYFEFNQIGAWVGELTPCFLERMSMKEIEEREGVMTMGKTRKPKGKC